MAPNADDKVDWPTHCPTCGTELRSEVLESMVTSDWDEGAPTPILAADVCPNPDCPAKVVGPEGTAPGAQV